MPILPKYKKPRLHFYVCVNNNILQQRIHQARIATLINYQRIGTFLKSNWRCNTNKMQPKHCNSYENRFSSFHDSEWLAKMRDSTLMQRIKQNSKKDNSKNPTKIIKKNIATSLRKIQSTYTLWFIDSHSFCHLQWITVIVYKVCWYY